MKRKKFSLISVVLSVICVVFAVESAAPAASLGNAQYFWWLFMIFAFLMPYGLVAAELGTTYQGTGGIYDWIHKAFPGTKWGARASWYYWVNFPIWMASLAIVIPWLIEIVTGLQFGPVTEVFIQLSFILLLTIVACFPISESIIILNVSAVIKISLAIIVGGLGIYYVFNHGFVNDMSPVTFLPSFDVHSLSFISVIMFNMLGFEVVCTYADSMEKPKTQIPQSIIVGGLVAASVYLFSSFGIGVAIPTGEIQTDLGIIEAATLVTGDASVWFVPIVALLLGLTFFGNMVSWSMGINLTSAYAADNDDMPKIFAKRWARNGVPVGGVMVNAIVASMVVLAGAVIDYYYPESTLFWSFFALNLVSLLLAYVPIFPAFYKLRKIDGKARRPYKVPGGELFLKFIATLPVVLILTAIFFTVVPLEYDKETLVTMLPITIGMIIVAAIGEILIHRRNKKRELETCNNNRN